MMFSSLPAPLQKVHLEVVPITGRNHEVNLTAIVLPIEANLSVFNWWIGENLQVKDTLQTPSYTIHYHHNSFFFLVFFLLQICFL